MKTGHPGVAVALLAPAPFSGPPPSQIDPPHLLLEIPSRIGNSAVMRHSSPHLKARTRRLIIGLVLAFLAADGTPPLWSAADTPSPSPVN